MAYDRVINGGRLEAARQRFYATRNKYLKREGTLKLCFEKLLANFDDPSLTIDKRSERLGLSESMLRRLYDTYFRHLYGGKRLHERYREYHKPGAAKYRALVAEFRALPWVEQISPLAEQAGHTVAPIITRLRRGGDRLEPHVLKKAALISGRRCIVYPITFAYETRTSGLRGRVAIRKETIDEFEVCIFPILIRDEIGTDLSVLVIPTPEVIELMSMRQGVHPALTIPLDSGLSGPSRSRAKLDPNRYDNAWDLIPAPARH